MSVASGLYKTVYGVGSGIGTGISATFNFLAGNTPLQKRGLERGGDAEFYSAFLGCVGGFFGTLITGLALAPVLGPVAAIPTVAALIAGGFGPAALNAAYIIGKDEHEKESVKRLPQSGKFSSRKLGK